MKSTLIALAALAAVGLAGCHNSSDTGPATASDKKQFAGSNDPGAKARDMAKMSAQKGGAPGAPPAGAGH